jgi:hypothetical protein
MEVVSTGILDLMPQRGVRLAGPNHRFDSLRSLIPYFSYGYPYDTPPLGLIPNETFGLDGSKISIGHFANRTKVLL